MMVGLYNKNFIHYINEMSGTYPSSAHIIFLYIFIYCGVFVARSYDPHYGDMQSCEPLAVSRRSGMQGEYQGRRFVPTAEEMKEHYDSQTIEQEQERIMQMQLTKGHYVVCRLVGDVHKFGIGKLLEDYRPAAARLSAINAKKTRLRNECQQTVTNASGRRIRSITGRGPPKKRRRIGDDQAEAVDVTLDIDELEDEYDCEGDPSMISVLIRWYNPKKSCRLPRLMAKFTPDMMEENNRMQSKEKFPLWAIVETFDKLNSDNTIPAAIQARIRDHTNKWEEEERRIALQRQNIVNGI